MGWATRLQLACSLAKAMDSYVVHFSEEALVGKRLGVGTEKFGISRGSLGIDCC